MKNVIKIGIIAALFFINSAWAADFCQNLNGTKWSGSYVTDASVPVLGTTHCVYRSVFTFKENGLMIDATKDADSSTGPFVSRCPDHDVTPAPITYSCSGNSFSYANPDPISAIFSRATLSGSGSFHHTVKVNYSLNLTKNS